MSRTAASVGGGCLCLVSQWYRPGVEVPSLTTEPFLELPLRQEGEVPLAWQPIDAEVLLVHSQHSSNALSLCNMNKSGIRHVHRKVLVLIHELFHSWNVGLIKGEQPDHAGLQDFPQGLLRLPGGRQEVHSFDDHRPDADQRVLNPLEGLYNLLMVFVAPPQEGNQRACINQNGAHSVGSRGARGNVSRCLPRVSGRLLR